MPVGWSISGADERFRQRMRERRYHEVLENPPKASLAELRRSCHVSQVALAATLGIGQIQVSRLERRRDMRLASLRGYVAGLGGHLELVVRMGERAVQLSIPYQAIP